jgi:flagellar export protein FliJ
MAKLGRFQFSLARVLGARETARRLAGARIAEANGRLRDAEVQLGAAERLRDQLSEELTALRSAPRMDIPACLSVEALLDGSRATVARCEAQVALREAERQAAIAAHAESHKKVEALTRLREARAAAHAQERRLGESKTMDEVAAVRAGNRLDGNATIPLLPEAP